MSAKKVLFLDVDGVLNSTSFDEKYSRENGISPLREDILDEDAIRRLSTIVETTSADVVLSSSWRKDDYDIVSGFLANYNMHILDVTPPERKDWNRGDEIMAWLREHPNVDRIAILDDATCLGALTPFLVLTTWRYGLLDQHITPAVALLNSTEEIDRPWRDDTWVQESRLT